MYCKRCDLEIKGEDKNECPICGSTLVPGSETSPDAGSSEDEFKLQSLIEDIDQKVQSATEINGDIPSGEPGSPDVETEEKEEHEPPVMQSDTEQEAGVEENEINLEKQLEELKLDAEEDLSLLDNEDAPVPDGTGTDDGAAKDDDIEKALDDTLEELSLSDDLAAIEDGAAEEKQEEEQPEEPKAQQSDEPAEDDGFDLQKQLELELTKSAEEEVATDEIESLQMDAEPLNEIDEKSTQDILDRALTELEADVPPVPEKKKSSSAVLFIAAMIIAAVGVGSYYYFTQTGGGTADSGKITATAQKNQKQKAKAVQKAPVTKEAPARTGPADVAADKPAVVAGSQPPPSPSPTPMMQVDEKPQKQPSATVKEQSVMTAEAKPASPGASPVPEKQIKTAARDEKPAAITEERIAAEAAPRSMLTADKDMPYMVHAGSFRDGDVAQGEADRFMKNGFDAHVKKMDLGERGIWYRVMIGGFATKDDANSMKKELVNKLKVQARVINVR